MITRPELSRPGERCDKVSYYDTGRRPVLPGGLSRVGEGDPILLDGHTGDFPPGDLGHGPMK